MRRVVLDASAVLTWLRGEGGAGVVRGWLAASESGEAEAYLSVVNAGEVFYRFVKLGMRTEAQRFIQQVTHRGFPLRLVSATDARVWRAAELKARYPIAYADGFAAALASEVSAPLLTCDPEFRGLQRDGVIEVLWVR